ncbi:hypothetical protein Droror1_Dr00010968 [Drosera rotundifolia]
MIPSLIKQTFLFVLKSTAFPITIRQFTTLLHKPLITDSYQFTQLLTQCKTPKALQILHAQIIILGYDRNPFVASKLMGKYAECLGPDTASARKVFDGLPERDVFVWNVAIQRYIGSGRVGDVVGMFREMWGEGVRGNEYTFTFVLKACGSLDNNRYGETVHGIVVRCGIDRNVFVCNALVAFYGKHYLVGSSRMVFNGIMNKDVVSWNTMISCYVDNGLNDEAIMLLHEMMRGRQYRPDRATLVSILPACAQESAIKEGLWVHSYIVKSSMELDAALGSGLISMYANCGRLSSAKKIFEQIRDKNIVVWHAMIRCYGTHGHADEALNMFSELVETGATPDGPIFSSLLSACSHAGKITAGREVFRQTEHYQVSKSKEHYACMVDLLSRAGLIEEAVECIRSMPFEPGKDIYGALLGACRIHGNVELAEEVAEKLFALDPENAGRYILLAKMYEDAGRPEDVARMRRTLKEKNIRKPLGYSAVEVDHVLHKFGVEDEAHALNDQVFRTLKELEAMAEFERSAIHQDAVQSY